MTQSISCQLMEEFVLSSQPKTCEKMIGYRQCKATNPMQVSASCDLDCQCKVTNGSLDDSCQVLFLMRSDVKVESIELSEIEIYF